MTNAIAGRRRKYMAVMDDKQKIEELEAKLAKAIAALDEALYFLDPDEDDIAKEAGLYRIVTTYKELKENAK
jgi:hypothetical protein